MLWKRWSMTQKLGHKRHHGFSLSLSWITGCGIPHHEQCKQPGDDYGKKNWGLLSTSKNSIAIWVIYLGSRSSSSNQATAEHCIPCWHLYSPLGETLSQNDPAKPHLNSLSTKPLNFVVSCHVASDSGTTHFYLIYSITDLIQSF